MNSLAPSRRHVEKKLDEVAEWCSHYGTGVPIFALDENESA